MFFDIDSNIDISDEKNRAFKAIYTDRIRQNEKPNVVDFLTTQKSSVKHLCVTLIQNKCKRNVSNRTIW